MSASLGAVLLSSPLRLRGLGFVFGETVLLMLLLLVLVLGFVVVILVVEVKLCEIKFTAGSSGGAVVWFKVVICSVSWEAGEGMKDPSILHPQASTDSRSHSQADSCVFSSL